MMAKGIYKDKSGNTYRVVGTALHETSREYLVIYETHKCGTNSNTFRAMPEDSFKETFVYLKPK